MTPGSTAPAMDPRIVSIAAQMRPRQLGAAGVSMHRLKDRGEASPDVETFVLDGSSQIRSGFGGRVHGLGFVCSQGAQCR